MNGWNFMLYIVCLLYTTYKTRQDPEEQRKHKLEKKLKRIEEIFQSFVLPSPLACSFPPSTTPTVVDSLIIYENHYLLSNCGNKTKKSQESTALQCGEVKMDCPRGLQEKKKREEKEKKAQAKAATRSNQSSSRNEK